MGVLLRPSPAALLAPPLATRGSAHGQQRHSKLVGSFRNGVLGGQGLRSLKVSTVGFKGLRVTMPPVVDAQEVEHQEVVEGEERERLGGEVFVKDLECMDLCGTSRGLCDTVIGVLGGGQLGRMLCQAGSPMGVKVAVLDPLPDCPASRIAFRHQVGSFRDTEAVREFANECGALTVEIEHVDVETLEALAREGVDVEPKPSTIRVIQDKYLQKMHFKQHGVALPEFMKIDSLSAAVEAGKLFGYPLMLKSRRLAYDGRGNAVAKSERVLPTAIAALGGVERGLYVEKWAPFVKELAVIVARGRNACIRSFPVVETTHKDSICHTVVSPAQVAPDVAEAAMQVAERAVGSLSGAGIFAVELFLLEDGKVLLNEVAPRPHNSGHHTIEACYVSQYEQHLRCILGLPLGDPAMRVPAAMMYNLLGEAEGEEGFAIAHETMMRAMSVPGASVHWYEKPEIRKQRKMGHITVVGPSMELVRSRMDWIVNGKDLSQYEDKPLQTAAHTSLLPVFSVSPTTDSGSSARSGPPVSIIMGSDSDLQVMKSAAEILQSFNIPYELTVVSAHRTPERMIQFAQNAHKRGVKVIIAGAGGAAHLPGMVASMTPLPVIGVPVKGTSTDGLDSLLSIAQMPRGIPVATVAIQNATNAGLTAVRILGVESPEIDQKMIEYQNGLKEMVLEKAERLERVGWQEYLNKRYESEPLQTPPRDGSGLPMFVDSPTDSRCTASPPPVGIIMGSDSDLPVMMHAAEILQLFKVPYELTVVSAHRTPERMVQYAQNARKRGVKVIIAGAGGAAHLPGMVASMTSRPIIGVPVKGSSTDGLDSLLSIVQMPRGIPVATVAIQNATNAGLLAVRVLGVESPELVKKMIEYQNGLKEMVLETAERLERVGWQEYLNAK